MSITMVGQSRAALLDGNRLTNAVLHHILAVLDDVESAYELYDVSAGVRYSDGVVDIPLT